MRHDDRKLPSCQPGELFPTPRRSHFAPFAASSASFPCLCPTENRMSHAASYVQCPKTPHTSTPVFKLTPTTFLLSHQDISYIPPPKASHPLNLLCMHHLLSLNLFRLFLRATGGISTVLLVSLGSCTATPSLTAALRRPLRACHWAEVPATTCTAPD